jgi:hypothetical protein
MIDFGTHLRISWVGVHAPKLPKLVKISKDQKQALSWQHNAFYHTVICVLTQEGHYVSWVAHLGLTVNLRNTNSTYSGPFDNNGEVNTDDAVHHLAKTGWPVEWAAHKSIVEFTWSYICEWICHCTPSSRDNMRLRCIYISIYYYRLLTRAWKLRILKETSPKENLRDDQQETLLVALIDNNVKLARRP